MSAPKARLAHVFMHQGASWYVPYTLRTCRKSDPEIPVMLIAERNVSPQIGFSHIREYETSADVVEFNRAYLHLSTNEEGYEKFCFQRWFYLLQHMRRHDLDGILHHDSDVLFFSTLARIHDLYGESLNYAAVCALPSGSMSGHSSYWSRAALEDFCQYLLRQYTRTELRNGLIEMGRRYSAMNLSGGICDMTLISNFARQSSRPMGNLLEIRGGSAFDHGVHVSDGAVQDQYRMEKNLKVILKKGRDYFFVRDADGQAIQALSLHCQGGYKKLIDTYYRGGFQAGKFIKDSVRHPKSFLKNLKKSF